MSKRLRLLNVEDSEADVVILERHLAHAGYEIDSERVETAETMSAALKAREWDIILCDYTMPHFDALAALKVLHDSSLDIPLIIISGTVGEEVAVEAMLTGANDYIAKGNLTRLIPAIERELHQANNRREQEQTKNQRAAIFAIIQGSVSTPNLDDFLKLVHRSVGRIVDAENFVIMLYDRATDTFEYDFWADKRDPPAGRRPVGKGFGSYVLRTGRPLLLTKERRKELVDRGEATLAGTPSLSWLGVPLHTPTGTIGVMVVQHYEKENAYDEHDLEFLSSVGDQIALAIERKRAEVAVRDSEERYRLLFERNPQPMWVFESETLRFLEVNEAAVEHYGYPRDEFLSMTILDIRPLADRDSVLKSARDNPYGLQTGQLWRHLRKDGTVIDVEINSHAFDFGGIPARLVLANDITEKKRAEEELSKSEERYRELVENAIDIIYTADITGRITSTNSAGRKATGYTKEESLELNMTELLAPEYVDIATQTIARRYAGEDMPAYEVEIMAKEGHRIPLELNTRIIYHNGVPTGLQGIARDITERKRAEKQLRLQATVLEAAANAIVITDPNGTIAWVNRAFTDLTGYTLDEAIGQNPSILKSGKMDQESYKTLWDTVLSGHAWQGEMINRRKDGTTYSEEQTITPVMDEAGQITNFIAVKQDITERKRADEALRESEHLLRESQEIAGLGSFVLDIATGLWKSSDVLDEVFGIDEAYERSTEGWADLIHPDDRTMMLDYFKNEVLGKGQTFDKEYRIIRHNDLAERWVHGLGKLEFDALSHPLKLRGTIQDITGRKQSDEAVRDSEKRFSGAFEFAPIGVALLSPDGHWLKVNRAMCDLVGYSEEELLKITFQEISYDEDLVNDLDHLHRLLAGEFTSYQIEKRYIHKLGQLVPVLLNVSLVRDELGKPRYLISQIQDMTSRKQLEEQFRQSQKMEAVGVLAGGIAHDFNNLLTAINGYSDLTLRKMKPDDPLRHNVEEVKKAGDRAAELTSQLLAFSRKQVLKPLVHGLNSAIENIERMLRRIIRENIELRTVLDPTLGNVKADPSQIEQVIINLAVNARDAMPHGGTLTIETQNVYLDDDYVGTNLTIAPGPFVRLTVTDTGEGMDENIRRHVFEPFFTTKEVGKGTGLGLAMVYGVVKQSGGDIMVYSELGHGTTFKIYLPRVDETVDRPMWTGGREQKYLGNETILLVEDEAVVRNLAREILAENGYHVLEAGGGKEALAVCASYDKPIHLLLSDVIMPKMSGGELKDEVVKILPDIKILFMSGYTDDTIANRGVFDADIAFIEKPFTPDALSRKVREVLEF